MMMKRIEKSIQQMSYIQVFSKTMIRNKLKLFLSLKIIQGFMMI